MTLCGRWLLLLMFALSFVLAVLTGKRERQIKGMWQVRGEDGVRLAVLMQASRPWNEKAPDDAGASGLQVVLDQRSNTRLPPVLRGM
jgi:hypothetical protein